MFFQGEKSVNREGKKMFDICRPLRIDHSSEGPLRTASSQELAAFGNPASQMTEMLAPQSASGSSFFLSPPLGAEMEVKA